MQQGENIGAFVRPKPKAPLAGTVAHRIASDRGNFELRTALMELGHSCVTLPDAKLFDRLNPNRPNISLNAWCEGVAVAANNSRCTAPSFRRFEARVLGWCESLVMLPAISFSHEWRADTVTDSVADVLKQQMHDAIASGNVALINECQVAIRTNMFHGDRMIAALEDAKQSLLVSRGSVRA